MGGSMNGEAQEAIGRNPSAPFFGSAQGALFEVRPTWRDFLRWLIGRDLKGFSMKVYGQTDPDTAADSVLRILENRHKRHFDVQWLDLVAEYFGSEGAEAIVYFVCERFGYERPAKKPDPVRVQEELQDVRRGLADLSAGVEKLTKAVAHIEKGIG